MKKKVDPFFVMQNYNSHGGESSEKMLKNPKVIQ